MKLLVLGGCADMAVPLLKRVRDDALFDEVILADLDAAKARRLAAEYGPKFQGVFCDATDSAQIISLMQGCNVVACYVGPFYRFERPLAACAIEAGVHYVSIADDYDAYLDVSTLDDTARQAGVKILTGFGNSPGITQVLAAKGYHALDRPRRIHVNWCAGAGERVGTSNLMHLFHIFEGTTLQWRDGQEVRVQTGTAPKRVKFPEPINEAVIYYTGHAESVSLPRNLPGLEEVTLHGGAKPHYIITLLKLIRATGAFKTHRRRAALARFFHHVESWFPSGGLDKSVGRVEIIGEKEGREICLSYTYVGHIADITSMPVYLAAKRLCEGAYDDLPGGVYAPERILKHPDDFLEGLKELGVDIRL